MSGERLSADVAIVGAGLAGLAAARAVAAAGQAAGRARGPRPGRRQDAERADRRGQGGRDRRPMGRPDQKRVLALIAELGLETFPTYGEGRNLFERRGRIRGYQGTIPRVSPLALAETAASLRRVNRDGRDDRSRAPLGGAEGRELGLADLRHLDAPQRPHPDRARPDAAGDLGGLGGRARGRLAAPRPLLHPLGGLVRGPDRHRGRRPGRAGPRRHAADLAADGRGAGRPGRPRRPGAADRARHRHRHGQHRRRGRGRGLAGDRRAAAGARREDRATTRRCRRSATGSPSGWRWAAWSSAWRSTTEPFWRAEGLSGPGDERRRPGFGHLRQLPSRRLPGRPARLPRGGGGAGGGRPAAVRAPGDRPRLPGALLRPAGGRAGALPRQGLGGRSVFGRLLRRLPADRRLESQRAGAAGPGRPDPLGGRRDGDRLERLHGRRDHLRRARRRRGAGGNGRPERWRARRWCGPRWLR